MCVLLTVYYGDVQISKLARKASTLHVVDDNECTNPVGGGVVRYLINNTGRRGPMENGYLKILFDKFGTKSGRKADWRG